MRTSTLALAFVGLSQAFGAVMPPSGSDGSGKRAVAYGEAKDSLLTVSLLSHAGDGVTQYPCSQTGLWGKQKLTSFVDARLPSAPHLLQRGRGGRPG